MEKTSIDNITFTEKSALTEEKKHAIADMGNIDEEIKDLERRYKRNEMARKFLVGALQAGIFVDMTAGQGAAQIDEGVAAICQGLQAGQNQAGWMRQQEDQQTTDFVNRWHQRRSQWGKDHIVLSRKAGKIVSDEAVNEHIENKKINS
jgi:hypothetical protein